MSDIMFSILFICLLIGSISWARENKRKGENNDNQ